MHVPNWYISLIFLHTVTLHFSTTCVGNMHSSGVVLCLLVAVSADKLHPECPRVCPYPILRPLCASNGITYNNNCEFKKAKYCEGLDIDIVAEGYCEEEPKFEEDPSDLRVEKHPGCPEACGYDYKPVCASDHLTYNNPCFFEKAKYCNGKDIYFEHKGPCKKASHIENKKKDLTVEKHPDCPKYCDEPWAPVCATNHTTYPNLCEFKQDKYCNGINTYLVYEGECKKSSHPRIEKEGHLKCPKVCPKLYSPVCASNGVTYDNPCEFHKAKYCHLKFLDIHILHQGICEKSPDVSNGNEVSKCPRFCHAIDSPLCGSNNVTYPNYCEFRREKYCKGLPINIDYLSECRRRTHHESMDPCFSPYNCLEGIPMGFKEGEFCKSTWKCPEIYSPVCTTNDISFLNTCFLRKLRCYGTNLEIKQYSECENPKGYDPDHPDGFLDTTPLYHDYNR